MPAATEPPGLRRFTRPLLWLGLWSAALLATLAICVLPAPAADPPPIAHLDKLMHAAGHALLASLAAMLFATRRALLGAMIGLLGFGIGIELLQGLLPWRSSDPLDVLANAAGTLLGAVTIATPLSTLLQRLDHRLDRWLAFAR